MNHKTKAALFAGLMIVSTGAFSFTAGQSTDSVQNEVSTRKSGGEDSPTIVSAAAPAGVACSTLATALLSAGTAGAEIVAAMSAVEPYSAEPKCAIDTVSSLTGIPAKDLVEQALGVPGANVALLTEELEAAGAGRPGDTPRGVPFAGGGFTPPGTTISGGGGGGGGPTGSPS